MDADFQLIPRSWALPKPMKATPAMRQSASFSVTLRRLAICGAILLSSIFAAAQNEKVIYAFQGPPDGGGPSGTLVPDVAGNLYGTTSGGGLGFVGTVYELVAPTPTSLWKEVVLYSFTADGDGAIVNGGVIFDTAGNLYGTTQEVGMPALIACSDAALFLSCHHQLCREAAGPRRRFTRSPAEPTVGSRWLP
jgi:hypothetical protein